MALVQDEKAHKEAKLIKGASGSKPCSTCKNVYQGPTEATAGSAYIKHYKFAQPSQFDRHTDASFWQMADNLSAKRPVMSKGAFEDLEQQYGLTYDPDGLLWDVPLRAHFRPVSG
eukprot:2637391-Pyramimonas_sp.AAC.1